jgi:hypothetical protein
VDRWLAAPGLAELSGATSMASLGLALSVDRGAGHLLPQRTPEFVADEIVAALPGGARSTLAGA